MSSPLVIYNAQLANKIITQDVLQKQVVGAFEDLYQSLNNPKNSWFFKTKQNFHGLYIYGSVGRGKTFLMDLFVDCMQSDKIRRQHFHQFMLWLHQQLRSIKKQQNPVDIVIANLAKEISILCLDEFLVHDITDAMLLANILFALQKNNISLVTTTNINPIHLYAGGLQRKKFIPAIQWMQKNMQIMQLDGDYDYRSHKVTSAKKWFKPISADNQRTFEEIFKQLVEADGIYFSAININKRQLNVIKRSKHYIMFDFATLCQQPRNASDFIKLTQQYQTFFIVINTAIAADDGSTARRFITLIDVLYDAGVSLYVLSNVDFVEIYQGAELAIEMQRTISRITEMQNPKSRYRKHDASTSP